MVRREKNPKPPPELRQPARGLGSKSLAEDEDFRLFADFIRNRLGIVLSPSRMDFVRRRLRRTFEVHDIHSFRELTAAIAAARSPISIDELADLLSTNHTFFFRDPSHFQFLTTTVLPSLEKRFRGSAPHVRIWSAASSTGEEPWSIAMTVRDYLGVRIEWVSVGILASDVSPRVLAIAERGVYPPERLIGVSDHLEKLWFRRRPDGSFEVRSRLREDVVFRKLNLLSAFSFDVSFDAVFCRNVMIYFDDEARKDLLRRLYQTVEPGGWLFVGQTESIVSIDQPFRFVAPGIFRREK